MTVADWIALGGVFPASVVFLLTFAVTRSPWWRSPLGWVMFGLAATSVLTYAVIALTVVLGSDYWGRDWIRGIAFTLLAAAYIAKTIAVVRERRKTTGGSSRPDREKTGMSHIAAIVPAGVKLAARRAFWRTTLQGYEALLYVSVTAQAVLSLVRGEVDLLVLGVNVAVAVAAPPVAGLRAWVSITRKGIPEDYENATLARIAVLDDVEQKTDLNHAVEAVRSATSDATAR